MKTTRCPSENKQPTAHWDLVIVDEAHRLKNPRSASAILLKSLRSRYLLLLTATPVENRLTDLFQLVSLVAPGLLGSAQQFRARHGGERWGNSWRESGTSPSCERALQW